MSIARALTKRIKASEDKPIIEARSATPTSPTHLNRSISTARRIDRAKISLPLELLSTTNVLAYEAPDLHPASAVSSPALSHSPATSPAPSNKNPISPLATLVESTASSASSTRSYDDASDASTTGPASTAASSVSSPVISREASPAAAALPELNHLSAYFPQHKPRPGAVAQATQRSLERAHSRPHPASPTKRPAPLPEVATHFAQAPPAAAQSPAVESPVKPAVPQRAPSHTKKNHQALARQRSVRSHGSRASLDTSAPAAAQTTAEATSVAPTTATVRSSAELFAGAAAAGVALDLRSASPTRPSHAPAPPAAQPPPRLSPKKLPQLPQVHGLPLPLPLPAPGKAKAGTGGVGMGGVGMGVGAREPHPFGAELAQVQEVAEEFGVRDVRIWDEEAQFLASQGLCRFAAEDYVMEIGGLMRGVFEEEEETWL